jgi:hypothetical protein
MDKTTPYPTIMYTNVEVLLITALRPPHFTSQANHNRLTFTDLPQVNDIVLPDAADFCAHGRVSAFIAHR